MMKKVLILVVLATLATQAGFADDRWSSTQDGIWNDDTTWNGNSYVTANDNAYLNGGTTVTVDGTNEQASLAWET